MCPSYPISTGLSRTIFTQFQTVKKHGKENEKPQKSEKTVKLIHQIVKADVSKGHGGGAKKSGNRCAPDG